MVNSVCTLLCPWWLPQDGALVTPEVIQARAVKQLNVVGAYGRSYRSVPAVALDQPQRLSRRGARNRPGANVQSGGTQAGINLTTAHAIGGRLLSVRATQSGSGRCSTNSKGNRLVKWHAVPRPPRGGELVVAQSCTRGD
jgi:hypothetical protein